MFTRMLTIRYDVCIIACSRASNKFDDLSYKFFVVTLQHNFFVMAPKPIVDDIATKATNVDASNVDAVFVNATVDGEP